MADKEGKAVLIVVEGGGGDSRAAAASSELMLSMMASLSSSLKDASKALLHRHKREAREVGGEVEQSLLERREELEKDVGHGEF